MERYLDSFRNSTCWERPSLKDDKTFSYMFKIQNLKHPGRRNLKATGHVELESRKTVGQWIMF